MLRVAFFFRNNAVRECNIYAFIAKEINVLLCM